MKDIKSSKKEIGRLKEENHIETLLNIYKWLRKQKYKDLSDTKSKRAFFRKRNASEILKDGFFSGCADYVIVAAHILRSFKIPTRIVQVVSLDWLKNKPSKIVGHVLLEIYIYNHWFVFDPSKGILGFDYSSLNFVAYKKGLNIQDINIKELDELKVKLDRFKKYWRKKNIK